MLPSLFRQNKYCLKYPGHKQVSIKMAQRFKGVPSHFAESSADYWVYYLLKSQHRFIATIRSFFDWLCSWLCHPYSTHWCVFSISKRHQQTSLLKPFLKNSDKSRRLYFLPLLGQLGTNIPKVALLLGIKRFLCNLTLPGPGGG